MIDMLNEFIGGIDGKPTFLLGNSKIIAKLKSVAQRAGYLTRAEDAFGKTAQGYDGIIFYDMGNYLTDLNSTLRADLRNRCIKLKGNRSYRPLCRTARS